LLNRFSVAPSSGDALAVAEDQKLIALIEGLRLAHLSGVDATLRLLKAGKR